MTTTAAIVIALIVGALVHRWIARPQPRPHDAESYWAGYRRGHDDGQRFRTVIERTPSPN